MCKNGTDILVDIPDKDLPELYKMYEKHVDWALQATCAIDNGIKWRKKTGDDSMVFMSPHNSWREDGSFLILMQTVENCYDIFVFTLDEECKNLYEGLMKTKRIDYVGADRVVFLAVNHRHFQPIKKVAEAKAPSLVKVVDTELFYVPIEEALKFEVSYPPEVHLEQLGAKDTVKINTLWPPRYKGSLKHIAKVIEVNNGFGLYLKKNDELVAWVSLGPVGEVATLQVVDECQKKGYAQILVRTLSKKIAQTGQIPIADVITSNEPSLNLFKKLNYKGCGLVHYIYITTE